MKLLQDQRFWLTGIAVALATIQLNLVHLSGHPEVFEPSLLSWFAVGFLLWNKQDSLKLNSNIWATLLGILLISWVLIRSANLAGYDSFLRISPLISVLGLGLLASGFQGVKQYWKECLAASIVAIPTSSLSVAINLSTLTAKFATMILWYVGYDITRQGVMILMPAGAVEVNPGCSGMNLILQLFVFSLLYLLTFSTRPIEKFLIPIAAITIAFITNSLRVVLMAILVSSSHPAAFHYWHEGNGSLIFSAIAVSLFGALCYFLLLRPSDKEQKFE